MGGSLPEYVFTRTLGIPCFGVPYANADEANHAPNENMELARFYDGIRTSAALLAHLGIENADVFGFSNGASVALQVAIRHPRAVRKLVFASSFTKKAGAQPQLWDMIRSADFAGMPQGLKDAFLEVTGLREKSRGERADGRMIAT